MDAGSPQTGTLSMKRIVIIIDEDDIPYTVEQPVRQWGARSCMHLTCPECHGTGIKPCGGACIHMLSCPCPRCSPTCIC